MKTSNAQAEAETKAKQSVVGCLVLFAALPFTLMWRGWVIGVLWGWFIVPLGVASIGVAHAIGLSCVVGLFTAYTKTGKDASPWHAVLYGFIAPALSLGMAWIVHRCM